MSLGVGCSVSLQMLHSNRKSKSTVVQRNQLLVLKSFSFILTVDFYDEHFKGLRVLLGFHKFLWYIFGKDVV